ncbi:hypothetical protein ANO14919_055560 [Xylariales sp. No.14919]|nr:hypothetical protein ANO14919_055560 [Xylariales sp. No.14919]
MPTSTTPAATPAVKYLTRSASALPLELLTRGSSHSRSLRSRPVPLLLELQLPPAMTSALSYALKS